MLEVIDHRAKTVLCFRADESCRGVGALWLEDLGFRFRVLGLGVRGHGPPLLESLIWHLETHLFPPKSPDAQRSLGLCNNDLQVPYAHLPTLKGSKEDW